LIYPRWQILEEDKQKEEEESKAKNLNIDSIPFHSITTSSSPHALSTLTHLILSLPPSSIFLQFTDFIANSSTTTMNDFDGLLASDFGLKPQGKSAPMAPQPKSSSNHPNSTSLNFDFGSRSVRTSDSLYGSSTVRHNRDTGSFDDLFTTSTGSKPRGADAPFDLDSMFPGSGTSRSGNSSPPPVYDKPVYDDDVFDGVPGLKSTGKDNFENVFASPKTESGAFDDLLGGFGKESKGSSKKGSEKVNKRGSDFDDLLPGFGSSRSPSSDR
jgi:hypothetical protein